MGPLFVNALSQLAAPVYILERESFSLVSVNMLGMNIYKFVDDQGIWRLGWYPFVKPTTRHVPLGPLSLHPPSVHQSWPLAEIDRMRRRSFTSQHFEAARFGKISRFASCFLSQSVVNACRDWQPRVPSSIAASALRHGSGQNPNRTGIVRLALPFSLKVRGVGAMLRRLEARWMPHLKVRGFEFEVAVSYKRGGIPLSLRVR